LRIYVLGHAGKPNSAQDRAVIREWSHAATITFVESGLAQCRSLSSGFRNKGGKTGFEVLPVALLDAKSKSTG
jgi:hypothetical protein